VPIHFRFGRAGNGVWPSLKVKNLQLPFYSIASHHPAGSSLIISLLILTGSIARIRMPWVRFAILIDYNSAQSRSIVRPRFNGRISFLLFARNPRAARKKGWDKRKRIGLHFVLIPTRGNTVPQFVNTGLFIYLLPIQVYTRRMAYRATVHADSYSL